MTFTYTNLPATVPRDAVRLLCRDTSSGSVLLQDEEIAFFLADKPNTYLAASAACEAIGAKFGQQVDKRVGDLEIRQSQKGSAYFGLAKMYRLQGVRKVKPYAGGISESDKDGAESDTDRVAPAFKVGQHDWAAGGSSS